MISMKAKVYKVGCSWEYIQDSEAIEREYFTQSEEFDDVAFASITDILICRFVLLRAAISMASIHWTG